MTAESIPIRRLRPDLSDVPRDWAGGDAQMTHVLNGLFALFPEGERFFCRSVRHYAGQTTVAPERLRGFYGQEANHGVAHREAMDLLERQGYRIHDWHRRYVGMAYGFIEPRVPPHLNLATTAALEHFTATLADIAFDPDDIVDACHPAMQQLIRWHAAEEIEHRSVAFDVLVEIDPRLRTRVLGFVVSLVVLVAFGMSAATHLARQDGLRGSRFRFLRELLSRPRLLRRAADFCRPRFHPDAAGPHAAASAYLATLDVETAA